MGKFITPTKPSVTAEKIMTAVRKHVKSVTCNVGTIDDQMSGVRQITIDIENDGEIGRDVVSTITAIKGINVVFTSSNEIEGIYDWRADRYIRPCSTITVSFK